MQVMTGCVPLALDTLPPSGLCMESSSLLIDLSGIQTCGFDHFPTATAQEYLEAVAVFKFEVER